MDLALTSVSPNFRLRLYLSLLGFRLNLWDLTVFQLLDLPEVHGVLAGSFFLFLI